MRVAEPLLQLSALTTTAREKNPDNLQSYPLRHASRSVKPHQDRERVADGAPPAVGTTHTGKKRNSTAPQAPIARRPQAARQRARPYCILSATAGQLRQRPPWGSETLRGAGGGTRAPSQPARPGPPRGGLLTAVGRRRGRLPPDAPAAGGRRGIGSGSEWRRAAVLPHCLQSALAERPPARPGVPARSARPGLPSPAAARRGRTVQRGPRRRTPLGERGAQRRRGS